MKRIVFLLILIVFASCEVSMIFIKGDKNHVKEKFSEDVEADPELIIDDNALIKGLETINPLPTIKIDTSR